MCVLADEFGVYLESQMKPNFMNNKIPKWIAAICGAV